MRMSQKPKTPTMWQIWTLLAVHVIVCCQSETVDIQTPSGPLRGRVDQVSDYKVIKFLNIPYAKPPVGDLRFSPPEPSDPWHEVRDATKYGPSCQQAKGYEMADTFDEALQEAYGSMSEDCLSINVFVPYYMDESRDLSVMAWVHGGGFIMGTSSLYDGSYIATEAEVILVTFNYRVGVFGFLSTEDDVSPGNYGLMDQIMAFQWIQDNIRAFGGNPQSVTIFGESAGGLSVSHHLLNIQTRGLFRRAIIQSGSNFGDTELCRESRTYSHLLGVEVGCKSHVVNDDQIDAHELVACLRQKSADDLVEAQNKIIELVMESGINCFGATVVDGHMITRHPKILLSESLSEQADYFRSIDIMAGTTNLEGAAFTPLITMMQDAFKFDEKDGVPAKVVCDVILPMFSLYSYGSLESIDVVNMKLCDRIATKNMIENGRNVTDFMGDVYFVVPTVRLLNAHASNNMASKTYHFLFSAEANEDVGATRPDWLKGYGAEHGTDELVMFGPEGVGEKAAKIFDNIEGLRRVMIRYWSNFAKTGDPNSDDLPEWPEYTTGDKTYMDITNTGPFLKQRLFDDRMALYNEEIPLLLHHQKDEL